MTVAHLREGADADHVVVLFLESAQPHRLARTHPDFDATLERLRAAASAGRPVEVELLAIDSAEILAVR